MQFTIPPIVLTILEYALIILGAYFVVFWFGLVAWTVQDICRRSRDWLLRIIAFLLVLVFHIPGLIIYLIIRPQETLADADSRKIEEAGLPALPQTSRARLRRLSLLRRAAQAGLHALRSPAAVQLERLPVLRDARCAAGR